MAGDREEVTGAWCKIGCRRRTPAPRPRSGRAPELSRQLPPRVRVATGVPRRRRARVRSVAHLLQRFTVMDLQLRERMDELKREWDEARRLHPRIVFGVAAAFALVAALLVDRRRLVPRRPARRPARSGRDAPHRRDGSGDRGVRRPRSLAFTIFKEQRIDVPLSEVSPNLIKAITSIEDQRFYDHHGFDLVRIASAALTNVRHGRARAGRQHHHAAARASELPDAGQDASAASCRS